MNTNKIMNAGLALSAINSRIEKFIVLDVEGYSTARPYNIGYIVADRTGHIYIKRSFALPACIWENVIAMIKSRQAEEMTKKNVEEILQDFEKKKKNRKYLSVSIDTFKGYFESDIKLYKVKRIFGYNVVFDKGAISRLYGADFIKLKVNWCDIITGIVTTKLQTKKYIDFCNRKGYITQKGNVQYKAEMVYQYLTGNKNFTEEHTGLADCMIEYEILLTVFNTHKKTSWKSCQAWRILNDYRKLKGIEIQIPAL